MRTCHLIAGIVGLLLTYAPDLYTQLPAQSGKWQLRENGTTGQGRYAYPSGLDGQRLEGFGGRNPLWGTYRKGRDEVVVLLVETDTRERAFGLFAASAGDATRHGIVGDAFAIASGVRHVNYGPFYMYFKAVGRRPGIPEDLIIAITRTLFNRADCYGSDIPLRMDDRVLGTEQYFPPDMRAWGDIRLPGLEPIRDIIRGRSAWIAQYSSSLPSNPLRWVILLPVRHKEALNALEAGIFDRYASEGTVIEGCPLAAFMVGTTLVYILPGREGLLIVLTSSPDPGGCEWARSLATGMSPF